MAGCRLASVEWGTGGRLAAALTAPAGASAYFLGGLVFPGKPAGFDPAVFGRRLGADLVLTLDGLADPPHLAVTEPTTGRAWEFNIADLIPPGSVPAGEHGLNRRSTDPLTQPGHSGRSSG